VLQVEESELLRKKHIRNKVEGFPLPNLEDIAQRMTAKGEKYSRMDWLYSTYVINT